MSGASHELQHLQARIRNLIEIRPELGVRAVAKLAEIAEELEESSRVETTSASIHSSDLDKITDGFKAFKKRTYSRNPELTNQLKTGQWPKVRGFVTASIPLVSSCLVLLSSLTRILSFYNFVTEAQSELLLPLVGLSVRPSVCLFGCLSARLSTVRSRVVALQIVVLLVTCAVHGGGLCGFESVSDDDSGSAAGRRLHDPKCSEFDSSLREGVRLSECCFLLGLELDGPPSSLARIEMVDRGHKYGIRRCRLELNSSSCTTQAGNPSVGSAVEYAVLHLKVSHILVIGHRACGGIGALVKMTPDDGKFSTEFIERWMEIGKPARESILVKELRGQNEKVDDICKTCEKESVNNSLANLLTYPFLVEAVMSDRITLHGGYYDHIAGTFQKWNYDVAEVLRH